MSTQTLQFAEIPLANIQPSPSNPRKTRNEHKFADLVASIVKNGVQTPIKVRPHPAGTAKGEAPLYEIIYGEGRWRASKQAGRQTIPATIEDMDDQAVLEAQLIENSIREDPHPLEEAEGYASLIEKHGYTPAMISEKIGKSERYVQRRLKLASLIPAAKEHFYAGRLTLEHYLQLESQENRNAGKAEDWQGCCLQRSRFRRRRGPGMIDRVCVMCGCSEYDACLIEKADGSFTTCSWLSKDSNVCTACVPIRTPADHQQIAKLYAEACAA